MANKVVIFLFMLFETREINSISLYQTILVHGIASSKNEMVDLENYLKSQHIETHNIEIGNGELTSIFMPLNEQCSILAEHIKNIYKENKENQINIIAISQGGLLARCYVEKYTHLPEYPKVNALLTMGTPHMGIYYSQNPDPFYKNIIKDYWKDPFNYESYIDTNEFLAVINNEKPHANSAQYKENMVNINMFNIVWSAIDDVIAPYQSAQFEFYNITDANSNHELEIMPLSNSSFYKDDLLGLKTLNETNRLQIMRYDCEHNKFKTSDCFIPILEKISK